MLEYSYEEDRRGDKAAMTLLGSTFLWAGCTTILATRIFDATFTGLMESFILGWLIFGMPIEVLITISVCREWKTRAEKRRIEQSVRG